MKNCALHLRARPRISTRPPWQSASETPAGEAFDTVVFITNFFDELRRLTAAGGK